MEIISISKVRSDNILKRIVAVINETADQPAVDLLGEPFIEAQLPTLHLEVHAMGYVYGAWAGYLKLIRDSIQDMVGRFQVDLKGTQFQFYEDFLKDVEEGLPVTRLYIWFDNGREHQIIFFKNNAGKYIAANAWIDGMSVHDRSINNYCGQFKRKRKDLLQTWRTTNE